MFWAKLDFEIVCSAVILVQGLTLDTSRALLRRKNVDGKSKVSNIGKDEDWVSLPFKSVKTSFEVIFWSKIDFEIVCSAAIPVEGPTLDASRALLKHKIFEGEKQMSKIKKDEDWVG